MTENTREIVLDTLLVLEKEQEYSHRLIKAVLDKYDYLSMADKAFIKRVTEGTIERRLELDYILNSFSSVKVNKMKPLIRCLLRMSVYQILYMDSIPDSAVCNEAVKLASKRRFQNLKGFVNGILRNICKNKEQLPMPKEQENPVLFCSVKYSMPEWIVRMWFDTYGEDVTKKLLQGLLCVHPVSIRFRTNLSSGEAERYLEQMGKQGIRTEVSPYLPYVYRVEGMEGVAALPGYEEGAFTVQDVSSALAVEAAGIRPEHRVMDVCAAPGGKSLLAAEKGESVLARDVSEYKIQLLAANCERMDAGNVEIEQWDGRIFDETKEGTADVVLLDVPCSGLGVMGKKRDIKYHVTPESMQSLTGLQQEIIRNSIRYVKPGGILIYSTCTIHRAENEEMARWISQNAELEPESLEAYVPERLWKEKKALEAMEMRENPEHTEKSLRDCWIQLLPGFMEADGFFFARFRKKL